LKPSLRLERCAATIMKRAYFSLASGTAISAARGHPDHNSATARSQFINSRTSYIICTTSLSQH
jgi:hypothetical protein